MQADFLSMFSDLIPKFSNLKTSKPMLECALHMRESAHCFAGCCWWRWSRVDEWVEAGKKEAHGQRAMKVLESELKTETTGLQKCYVASYCISLFTVQFTLQNVVKTKDLPK